MTCTDWTMGPLAAHLHRDIVSPQWGGEEKKKGDSRNNVVMYLIQFLSLNTTIILFVQCCWQEELP
jgi:hypothetical protein